MSSQNYRQDFSKPPPFLVKAAATKPTEGVENPAAREPFTSGLAEDLSAQNAGGGSGGESSGGMSNPGPSNAGEGSAGMSNPGPSNAGETSAGGNNAGESSTGEFDFSHKHPLHNAWTWWYLNKEFNKTWEEQLHVVHTIDMVEDYWCLARHISPPSALRGGCDYLFFKKDIRPMWEDDANKQGGRWVITLNKTARKELDKLFEDTCLCLIGEACESMTDTCGCVVNIRGKFNKISLWTANGNNHDAVMEIGKKWKEELGWPHEIVYELHAETSTKTGSLANVLHRI